MRTIHMPKVNQKNRPFGLWAVKFGTKIAYILHENSLA